MIKIIFNAYYNTFNEENISYIPQIKRSQFQTIDIDIGPVKRKEFIIQQFPQIYNIDVTKILIDGKEVQKSQKIIFQEVLKLEHFSREPKTQKHQHTKIFFTFLPASVFITQSEKKIKFSSIQFFEENYSLRNSELNMLTEQFLQKLLKKVNIQIIQKNSS